jgi:hypothetical protein
MRVNVLAGPTSVPGVAIPMESVLRVLREVEAGWVRGALAASGANAMPGSVSSTARSCVGGRRTDLVGERWEQPPHGCHSSVRVVPSVCSVKADTRHHLRAHDAHR